MKTDVKEPKIKGLSKRVFNISDNSYTTEIKQPSLALANFALAKKIQKKDTFSNCRYTTQSCRGYLHEDVISNNVIFKYTKTLDRAAFILQFHETHLKNILEVLHYVEEKLKVGAKTRIHKTNLASTYIAVVDPVWVETPANASLWSLIVRITIRTVYSNYKGPEHFLSTAKVDFWDGTYKYIDGWAREKYEYFMKNGFYKYDKAKYNTHHGNSGAHDAGILTLKVPGLVPHD